MTNLLRAKSSRLALVTCVLLSLASPRSLLAQTAAPAGKSKHPEAYAQPTDPALYVGSETCKTCHENMPAQDFFKHYEDSPHFATTLDTRKGPEWHGCEACHGPGKAHVDGKLVCEAEIKCLVVPRTTRKAESQETPTFAGAAAE